LELTLQSGALLLFIAALVAVITRRLRLPYVVGLVLAGIGLSFLPYAPNVILTKDLLFTALLPPLLFEAALSIPWRELRPEMGIVTVMATIGVGLSAGVTSVGMHFLAGWQWISALVFGVLIAATDPVSVIAIFREAKAKGRLLLLIETESLFNDGTAAVAFAVVLAAAGGASASVDGTLLALARSIGGGFACGAAVAMIGLLLIGRTDDHLVEIAVTTVAAYGSFLLAENFGLSGVLATITAGLYLGNFRSLGTISVRGKEAVAAFWEYAAFTSNSLIFLLMGMRVGHQDLLAYWRPSVIAIALVTLGRAAAIYPCCALFAASSQPVSARHQHFLFWGGLRGALALALALGLPSDLPYAQAIVTTSFAVVAFSIFVQGLTVAPLLRRAGEIRS
jgi:CPA1 family monovalent cation:H+ antiporter